MPRSVALRHMFLTTAWSHWANQLLRASDAKARLFALSFSPSITLVSRCRGEPPNAAPLVQSSALHVPIPSRYLGRTRLCPTAGDDRATKVACRDHRPVRSLFRGRAGRKARVPSNDESESNQRTNG